MRGAVIFLAVFAIALLVTLTYPDIPPGKSIYTAIGARETDEEIQGFGVTALVIAVFNGVIYGFIVWLIADIVGKVTKSENKRDESRREEE
jgi:large-conductance mechanosensitive channel